MVGAGADFALAARADHVARADTDRCRETTRRGGRASSRRARRGRTSRSGLAGCERRRRSPPAARSSRGDTSRSPTPTRCRPRRRARSRSAGNCATGAMPVKCIRRPCRDRENGLDGCWPSTGRSVPERVAPGVDLPRQATARRKLPLRFRRQALAGPPRVGERVLVRHVHDRIRSFPSIELAGPGGWRQFAPFSVRPPAKVVVERHGVSREAKTPPSRPPGSPAARRESLPRAACARRR